MANICGEVDKWKKDYVYLLQSSITVPTGDLMDGMQVKLYGGNTVSHKGSGYGLYILKEVRSVKWITLIYRYVYIYIYL